MFGDIRDRFDYIFNNLRGLGKITDSNINDTARLVRRALMEADVNFKVVKTFVSRVIKNAQGTKVIKSVKPGEHFIKVIRDELVLLLESESSDLILNSNPSTIMLVGLQGAGKTSTAGKLASKLKKDGKSVMLIGVDIYRPAAVEQLKKISKQIDVDFYSEKIKNVLNISFNAMKEAKNNAIDVVIFDTAGRLHINEKMMYEINEIYTKIKIDEILFIADAMTGQDAVKSVSMFHEMIPINGIIMTKMDGDSKGGAAVSMKEVTGVPIKFFGVSESIDGLKQFDARVMADRILGFNDVISLVEKAEKYFDADSSKKLNKRIKSNSFDLNDFQDQIQKFKSLESMSELAKLIPGVNRKMVKNLVAGKRDIIRTESIINSMTKSERKKPEKIDGSRRLRIAKGSGRTLQEVNILLKQFAQMKKMIKKINKGNNFRNISSLQNFIKF